MDATQHNPVRLYNCDETGVNIVQQKKQENIRIKK